ncbi:MAG: sugar transferase [Planctomycetaceae bacterium]|jgi:lipopolysaccharide/colanic/teichoic acid biosynthesis glycosyltransferase|nr:sugar transferase [Planctomycetaceae bacterium]
MLKRLFDIFLSIFGLILLIPIFLTAAVLIKITSRGPILFCQQRVGRFGKDFVLYKFRSMHVCDISQRDQFHAGDQSRITSIGWYLRKTKIDELPQLYNVLIGDMSFVGPRPEVREWVNVFPEHWKIIHQVRPGITDNASIMYRNEEQILTTSSNPNIIYRNKILPQKLDLYKEYIQNQSLLIDLCLIFKTLYVIVKK